MKLIITGGAGFIGINTAYYFLKKGWDIVIFDNLSRKGSKDNLAWLKAQGFPFTSIKGEIRNPKNVEKLRPHVTKSDAVIHLAAQVAVTTSVTDPRNDFEINALGTFNILELMRTTKNNAKFIYSSTNKVYGGMESVKIVKKSTRYMYKNLPHGVSEAQPLDFHSPYGCSKGAADQYVHDYGRIYGLDTVVMRQSCIYGPRQFGVEDQGWVAWFIIAISKGVPITIYGDGKQVRDLLYVEDLVRAYEKAIAKKETSRGQIYNLGGGMKNSLSIWAEFKPILEKLFGKKIPTTLAAWRPGDQPVYISDIRKAQRELGWKPKVSVKEGITKLHSWVTANPDLFT